MVEVSAKKKINLDKLMDTVLLVARVAKEELGDSVPGRGLVIGKICKEGG